MSIISPAATAGGGTISCPFPTPNSTIPLFLPPLSLPTKLRCPSSRQRSPFRRLQAALSPKPPDTQPEPPPPENDREGGIANFSRFQDRVQIFFAVLFWMSLFFWASAWDGRNRSGGRLNKGSRFRR